jgi:tellurite resistance protein TerC
VFASNAFALLGLRSLYFVLASALRAFRYLKVSLAIVLGMVGSKMIAHDWLKEQLGDGFNLYVLGAIVAVLTAGALLSLLITVSDQPASVERERT